MLIFATIYQKNGVLKYQFLFVPTPCPLPFAFIAIFIDILLPFFY
jgi:hypothetical protein